MDWEDGIAKIDNESIDLVVTDPPYAMAYRSNRRKRKHMAIKDDDNLFWLDYWVVELKRVCKPDAHLYIFCSWHNVDVFKKVISQSFNIKNILIWVKNNHGSGDLLGDYAPQYEMVIFCSNGLKKLNGNRISNVLKSPKIDSTNHPTEKPINILRLMIEKSSQRGGGNLRHFCREFFNGEGLQGNRAKLHLF